MLEVQPDVECRLGRDVDFQTHVLKTLQDMITLVLKVFLQCQALNFDTFGVKKRNRGKLKSKVDVALTWVKYYARTAETYGWLAPPSKKDPD